MKQLIKHKLNFDPTWVYIQDDLDKTNALSSELLNLLTFDDGDFFTLLPSDACLKQIYDFKSYGILPQYPEEEYVTNGIKSTYSLIPTIRDDLSQWILKEITSNNDISCIFDDVSCSLKEVDGYDLFVNHGLYYNNEIYYFLDKKNVTVDLISKCLHDSNSFWHSLCIFTKIDFNNIEKKLNLENIKQICLKTELFMIGAYDSEGYVFWEKKGCKFFESQI